MTAWRSPQVERLYDILKNTDWGELAALKAENERLKIERDYLVKQIAYCGHCQFFKDESASGAGYCNLLSKSVNCDDSHHDDIAKCFIWKSSEANP